MKDFDPSESLICNFHYKVKTVIIISMKSQIEVIIETKTSKNRAISISFTFVTLTAIFRSTISLSIQRSSPAFTSHAPESRGEIV